MTTSESIKEIATALAKAQSEFEGIIKDASNPFFKSKYATLDNIVTTVKPVLAKYGLSVSQGNEPTESGIIVTTLLMHTSGEWLRSELSMPVVKNDPQGYGSAITYGRRYAYSAILGVATEEDDDANSASTKNGTVSSPVKKIQSKYTPDPIMDATEPFVTCSHCHAPKGKPHATGCPNAN